MVFFTECCFGLQSIYVLLSRTLIQQQLQGCKWSWWGELGIESVFAKQEAMTLQHMYKQDQHLLSLRKVRNADLLNSEFSNKFVLELLYLHFLRYSNLFKMHCIYQQKILEDPIGDPRGSYWRSSRIPLEILKDPIGDPRGSYLRSLRILFEILEDPRKTPWSWV
jgi:hypothetical protein